MLRAKRLAPNIAWIDFKDWDGISKKELLREWDQINVNL